MAYASVGDLDLPDGLDVPADAARMLDRASELLDGDVLTRAVYDVDDDGAPTDARVVDVLKRAVCAQVAWWVETGDEQGAASALSGASGAGPSWSGNVPRLAPQVLSIIRGAVDSSGSPLLAGPWMR